MTQHTQEPWRFHVHFDVIHTSDIGLIELNKIVCDMRVDNAKHNGRRIVACVNACAGMSNEQLDNISLISGSLLGRFTEQANILNQVEQQRDQAFKDLAEIRALVGAQTEELIQDAIKRLIAERDQCKADFEAQFNKVGA